jgi:ATP-dependent RNA helicase DHX57
MLVLATVFQCLDPMLTIAACLSSKPVFLSPMDERDEATAYDLFPHTSPTRELNCSQSARTLRDWEKRHPHRCSRLRRVHANTPRRVPKSHARILYRRTSFLHLYQTLFGISVRAQNYISATTIRDITVLRRDLLSALQSAGLVTFAPDADARKSEPELLTALLLAALYPRVARIALPRKAVKYTLIASGTVERDAPRGRVAREGHAWREGLGAPRQRAVRGDALAFRRRGELPARRDHQIVPAGRHRGQP